MKIALFGSAAVDSSQKHSAIAQEIGKEVSQRKHILITGGCVGIPSHAVQSAFSNRGETHGYFPVDNEQDIHGLAGVYNNDTQDHYTSKTYLRGFSKRSVAMLENSDAVIIVNGRMGTLSEFAMAVEEGLPIVVMEESGGIANHIKTILTMTGRDITDQIYFANNAHDAISWIEKQK